MRVGVQNAVHHAVHRHAFGKALVDQPLMRNVLADLVVESEAATTVAMRLAAATDAALAGDEQEAMLRRLGLAVSKYWVCKRGPAHAAEALECLGAVVLFCFLNAVVGAALIFVARAVSGRFVSLHLGADQSVLALSALQALLFQWWRESSRSGKR